MILSSESTIQKIKQSIRDIPDFPMPGIVFKDITPLLKNMSLCKDIVLAFSDQISPYKPDALACLDSRGFWFGLSIAMELGIPMVPIRKKGKLPYHTVSEAYDLEYGTNVIEMHTDAVQAGWKVFIHDDILATGGTAEAASKLIQQSNAQVAGYSFLIELDFLKGRNKLSSFSSNIQSLIQY
jgi:adenine phosphoribosyltransferase